MRQVASLEAFTVMSLLAGLLKLSSAQLKSARLEPGPALGPSWPSWPSWPSRLPLLPLLPPTGCLRHAGQDELRRERLADMAHGKRLRVQRGKSHMTVEVGERKRVEPRAFEWGPAKSGTHSMRKGLRKLRGARTIAPLPGAVTRLHCFPCFPHRSAPLLPALKSLPKVPVKSEG